MASKTMNVIEVLGVSKRYGDIAAVDGISLSVAQGEMFGLIGPNGAGKSTLFKLLLGLIAPDSGEIRVHCWSASDWPMRRPGASTAIPRACANGWVLPRSFSASRT